MGRNFQWATPDYIDNMFFDDLDHHGVLYWYNDIEQQHRELEAKSKSK